MDRNGAHSGIRTRTDDVLDVVPLLLGYMSFEMAPTAGLAPAKTDLKDLSRDDFAFMGIDNWRNAEDMLLIPHDGGTILLATSPGTLVRLTFLDEVVLPGGLSPTTSAFEARCSIH